MRFNRDRETPNRPARERARSLRRDGTPPERKLWALLRGGRLAGLKFRRQHPIGTYTADFYCAELCLVVELDGQHHEPERDRARDAEMEHLGLTVLRFSVSEFETNTNGVLETILRSARSSQAERKSEQEDA